MLLRIEDNLSNSEWMRFYFFLLMREILICFLYGFIIVFLCIWYYFFNFYVVNVDLENFYFV